MHWLDPVVLRLSQLLKKEKNSKLLLILPIFLSYIGALTPIAAQGELESISFWGAKRC